MASPVCGGIASGSRSQHELTVVPLSWEEAPRGLPSRTEHCSLLWQRYASDTLRVYREFTAHRDYRRQRIHIHLGRGPLAISYNGVAVDGGGLRAVTIEFEAPGLQPGEAGTLKYRC